MINKKNKYILASKSPRRIQLLKKVLSDFEVVPSNVVERFEDISPEQNALCLAKAKAAEISKRFRDSVVIGADTLVWLEGYILGKPSNELDAVNMLKKLSGKEHTVTTGVALINNGYEQTCFESTKVRFKQLTEKTINEYVYTREPLDKAGAYAIQGMGGDLVLSYTGSYSNIVGLPIELIKKMITDFDSKLSDE